jgi:hypothetical protein
MHFITALACHGQLLRAPDVTFQRFIHFLMQACDLVSTVVDGALSEYPVTTSKGILDSVGFFFPISLQTSDILSNP